MRDVREFVARPTLDEVGFELVPAPSAVSNFYNPDLVRSAYCAQTERLLKRLTGAEKVVVGAAPIWTGHSRFNRR